MGKLTDLKRVSNIKQLTMDNLLDLEESFWEAKEDIAGALTLVRDEIMDRVRAMRKKGLYIDSEVWERIRNFHS